jgi:hypothetical protein
MLHSCFIVRRRGVIEICNKLEPEQRDLLKMKIKPSGPKPTPSSPQRACCAAPSSSEGEASSKSAINLNLSREIY